MPPKISINAFHDHQNQKRYRRLIYWIKNANCHRCNCTKHKHMALVMATQPMQETIYELYCEGCLNLLKITAFGTKT